MTNADTDEREVLRPNAWYRRCIARRDVESLDRLFADDHLLIGLASMGTRERRPEYTLGRRARKGSAR